jgi:hypothetical protein
MQRMQGGGLRSRDGKDIKGFGLGFVLGMIGSILGLRTNLETIK